MGKVTKTKQVVVRFDDQAYDDITRFAEIEHRGLGEFVRHATLFYIERYHTNNISSHTIRGVEPT